MPPAVVDCVHQGGAAVLREEQQRHFWWMVFSTRGSLVLGLVTTGSPFFHPKELEEAAASSTGGRGEAAHARAPLATLGWRCCRFLVTGRLQISVRRSSCSVRINLEMTGAWCWKCWRWWREPGAGILEIERRSCWRSAARGVFSGSISGGAVGDQPELRRVDRILMALQKKMAEETWHGG